MQNKPVTRPAEAVRGALLQRGKETYVDPQQARSVAVLERHAPRFVQRAKKAGVTIEYLGSHPLFEESRLFNGPKTDWLLGPADSDAVEEIVPRAQLADLRRLSESGIDFPVVYVAHELPKGRVQSLVPADNALTPTMIDRTEAASLVDPAPVPRSTVELSERLSARSVSDLGSACERGPDHRSSCSGPIRGGWGCPRWARDDGPNRPWRDASRPSCSGNARDVVCPGAVGVVKAMTARPKW